MSQLRIWIHMHSSLSDISCWRARSCATFKHFLTNFEWEIPAARATKAVSYANSKIKHCVYQKISFHLLAAIVALSFIASRCRFASVAYAVFLRIFLGRPRTLCINEKFCTYDIKILTCVLPKIQTILYLHFRSCLLHILAGDDNEKLNMKNSLLLYWFFYYFCPTTINSHNYNYSHLVRGYVKQTPYQWEHSQKNNTTINTHINGKGLPTHS